MNKSILPDSLQSGKSDPAPKKPPLKNESEVLRGFITDTEHALQALQFWLASLKSWQYQEKISPEDFEGIYTVIRDANLGEWAKSGLDKLRAAVTGE